MEGVNPLTPGHFMTGTPLCALPSVQDKQSKITSLRRWNLVQKLQSEFWNCWKSNYLMQLNRRTKVDSALNGWFDTVTSWGQKLSGLMLKEKAED